MSPRYDPPMCDCKGKPSDPCWCSRGGKPPGLCLLMTLSMLALPTALVALAVKGAQR